MVNCLKTGILNLMSPALVTRRSVICLMGMLMSTPSFAQASRADLSKAMDRQDWDTALTLSQQLSGPDLEAVVAPAAQRGSVPAMWLMGQARHLIGDAQGSADWLYSALLGTRLDVSVCRDRRAAGITSYWVQGLREAVMAARMDAGVRAHAVHAAAELFQGSPRDPMAGWTCRWAAQHALIRPGQDNLLVMDGSQWKNAQARALGAFYKEAGITANSLNTSGSFQHADLLP